MKFQVGKWYTKGQMAEFMADKNLRQTVKVQGGIMQYEPTTGKVRITSWHDAAHAPGLGRDITSGENGRAWQSQAVMDDIKNDIAPLRKRTPQERLRSMMDRLVEDCKKYGTVPGVTDARVQHMVGEFWKNGVTEVDGEFVRRVAQHLLEQARKEQILQDHKKVVSTPGNDRIASI